MITAQLGKLRGGNQKIDTLKNIWGGWRNDLIQASNLFLVCLLHTVVFKLKGITSNRSVRRSRETLLGLKSYIGLTCDIGSLKAPSEPFFEVIVKAYEITETQIGSALCNHGIRERLMLCVCETEAYMAMANRLCSSHRLHHMMARFVRMNLHLVCARLSAQAGKGGNRLNRKRLKVE